MSNEQIIRSLFEDIPSLTADALIDIVARLSLHLTSAEAWDRQGHIDEPFVSLAYPLRQQYVFACVVEMMRRSQTTAIQGKHDETDHDRGHNG
jgi:hypothetical protein